MNKNNELIVELQTYENKLLQSNTNYHVQETIKNNTLQENLNIQNELNNIESEVQDLNTVKMLLETLKVYKLKEKKDFILTIINTALADIFQDNIRIAIEPKELSGKSSINAQQKFDIIFYQNDIELARNEELLISNGGGIMQVISMLFKLLIGFIYSKNTFYMFDESFSQLSSVNRIRLSKFLQQFCKTYNFTIVVVSQVLDLDEYADIIYTVSADYDNNGIRTLKLEESLINEEVLIRSIKPGEEGLWNISIQNFQSISSLDLTLKGYTIIRGPNNSGKSAILRAINSILYNSFNSKKFPRMTGNAKKVYPVDIRLSKIFKEGDVENIKSIGLKYKSNKVSFIIEDEEYFGKNLASEKLREKIEELGFKYINLKEFYKNFKGNLKDQTERIASTTQYDGLFIVGAKGNETEKIFNFLFNTEYITKAILTVKEDLIVLDNNYRINQEKLLANISSLAEITDLMNLYHDQYYEYSIKISEILKILSNINLDFIKQKENLLNELINSYEKLQVLDSFDTTIKTTILSIESNLSLVDNVIKQKTSDIEFFMDLQKQFKEYSDKLDLFENLIPPALPAEKSFDKKINILEQLILNLEHYLRLELSLNNMIKEEKTINNLYLNEEPVLNQLQLLDIKYKNLFNIEQCGCCDGTGFKYSKQKD